MTDRPACTFCEAVAGDTHITAVGAAKPNVIQEIKEDATYDISFLPSSLHFKLIKVASLAHAFKNNPINACEQCEKVVWAVVKELQK